MFCWRAHVAVSCFCCSAARHSHSDLCESHVTFKVLVEGKDECEVFDGDKSDCVDKTFMRAGSKPFL